MGARGVGTWPSRPLEAHRPDLGVNSGSTGSQHDVRPNCASCTCAKCCLRNQQRPTAPPPMSPTKSCGPSFGAWRMADRLRCTSSSPT
eukprot:4862986-Pyramimonas_sp.AAC.1